MRSIAFRTYPQQSPKRWDYAQTMPFDQFSFFLFVSVTVVRVVVFIEHLVVFVVVVVAARFIFGPHAA